MSGIFEDHYEVTVQRDAATGSVLAHFWRMNGQQHNETGPAIVRFDSNTGNPVLKIWKIRDRTSRPEAEGPAIIHYDPASGIELQSSYFLDGRQHRLNGPAHIERDAVTGQVTKEEYYRFDKPYRPPPTSTAPTPSP